MNESDAAKPHAVASPSARPGPRPWTALLVVLGCLFSRSLAHAAGPGLQVRCGEGLPGTSLMVAFTADNLSGTLGDRAPWRLGDRLTVQLAFTPADSTRGARDSLELTGQLGSTGLPIGLQWLVLGLGSVSVREPDWSRPVYFSAPELGARFAPRSMSPEAWGNVWVTLVSADTSTRAGASPSRARRQRAIIAYRDQRFDACRALAEASLDDDRADPLMNIVLAGALQERMDCDAYIGQCAKLEELGLRKDSRPLADERRSCVESRKARKLGEKWERTVREAHEKWERAQRQGAGAPPRSR